MQSNLLQYGLIYFNLLFSTVWQQNVLKFILCNVTYLTQFLENFNHVQSSFYQIIFAKLSQISVSLVLNFEMRLMTCSMFKLCIYTAVWYLGRGYKVKGLKVLDLIEPRLFLGRNDCNIAAGSPFSDFNAIDVGRQKGEK